MLYETLLIVFICNVFIAVALSFCAFCSPSVLGLPADDVVPIVDDEYYPQVHKALAAAKKSVFCVMFIADTNPKYANGWEYDLVNDLIDVHQRGISATVILDQNVTFWEEGGKGKGLEKIERKLGSHLDNGLLNNKCSKNYVGEHSQISVNPLSRRDF